MTIKTMGRWQMSAEEERAERERFDRVLMFEVTADHIKLLRHFYISWQQCETGAPEVNPKRPYGNSSVDYDVCEVLGWEIPGSDSEDFDPEESPALEVMQRAMTLHRETAIALQCVLRGGSFEPGMYTRSTPHDQRWVRLTSEPSR